MGQSITMQLITGKNKNKEADQALTTEAHLLLWRYLRLLELRGVTFIRHASIGGHYVDFLNMEKGLVMEVDTAHGRKTDKLEQQRKDRWLAKQGYKVLRFTAEEISDDMNMVLDMMWESFIDDASTPLMDEAPTSRALTINTMATKTLPEPSSDFDDATSLVEPRIAAISGRNKPN